MAATFKKRLLQPKIKLNEIYCLGALQPLILKIYWGFRFFPDFRFEPADCWVGSTNA